MAKAMFKKWDVVKIINSGKIYSTYFETFEYFNILHECYKGDGFYRLEESPMAEYKKYIVVNCVEHGTCKENLYHIRAIGQSESLVIGENGIEKINQWCYIPTEPCLETEEFSIVENLKSR